MKTNSFCDFLNSLIKRILFSEDYQTTQPRDRKGRWTEQLEVIEWMPIKDNR